MKFVIIGGDAAGMSAASRAKRIMPEMDDRIDQIRENCTPETGMEMNRFIGFQNNETLAKALQRLVG